MVYVLLAHPSRFLRQFAEEELPTSVDGVKLDELGIRVKLVAESGITPVLGLGGAIEPPVPITSPEALKVC